MFLGKEHWPHSHSREGTLTPLTEDNEAHQRSSPTPVIHSVKEVLMPLHPGQEPKAPSASTQSVPLTWRGLGMAANSSGQPACLKSCAKAYLSGVCLGVGKYHPFRGIQRRETEFLFLKLLPTTAHSPFPHWIFTKALGGSALAGPISQMRKLRFRLLKGQESDRVGIGSPAHWFQNSPLIPSPFTVFFLLYHWFFL